VDHFLGGSGALTTVYRYYLSRTPVHKYCRLCLLWQDRTAQCTDRKSIETTQTTPQLNGVPPNFANTPLTNQFSRIEDYADQHGQRRLRRTRLGYAWCQCHGRNDTGYGRSFRIEPHYVCRHVSCQCCWYSDIGVWVYSLCQCVDFGNSVFYEKCVLQLSIQGTWFVLGGYDLIIQLSNIDDSNLSHFPILLQLHGQISLDPERPVLLQCWSRGDDVGVGRVDAD
jgi:hypothetical protein